MSWKLAYRVAYQAALAALVFGSDSVKCVSLVFLIGEAVWGTINAEIEVCKVLSNAADADPKLTKIIEEKDHIGVTASEIFSPILWGILLLRLLSILFLWGAPKFLSVSWLIIILVCHHCLWRASDIDEQQCDE